MSISGVILGCLGGKVNDELFMEHTKRKIRIALVSGVKLGYKSIILGALVNKKIDNFQKRIFQEI